MALHNWLSSPFKFSVVPVSALLVVVYVLAFAAVSVTDATPEVPKDQGGLSLHQAYRDLHRITARPHPFISHDNDDVREYLLERLKSIVASHDHLHLSYDTVSNATWMSERGATYYESNNILVKIDGTEAPAIRSRGVLFSAHYDSVSTSFGATDDGMGIVTLLQMVEYLAKPERRPRRTAVFFFNNGEEDGLHGAHLYFEHPWSNLTTSFINLEGAAAGGRPMLFRSTSLGVARSFGAKGVHHPHGNVASADAFARGVIRSGTDYTVYAQGITGEKKGLEGLDFAFYKNRAFYHTPFDSISGMGRNEGRKALWAMMETVRGAGLNLLNGPAADDNTEAGVYFDVLGRTMVSFSLRTLFIVHVVALIIAPLVVLGLLGWVLLLNHKISLHEPDARPTHHTPLERMRLVIARIIGWGRFWIALLVTIGLNAALVAGYVNVNPYIIYSKPIVVLTTFLALTFLSYTATLSLFYKLWPSPQAAQKFAVILETYLLSWVFMVAGTVGVNRLKLGSPYLITAWYLCAWVTAVVALTEAVIRSKKHGSTPDLDVVQEPDSAVDEQPINGHRFVRGVMYTAPEHSESREEVAQRDTEPEETDPTEITPLIQQHRRRSTGGREYIIGVDNEPLLVNEVKKPEHHYEEHGWWIVQMITLIPLPTILLFQLTLILVHSLRNTLADGNSPTGVYTPLAAVCILLFINIAPFAHQVERTIQLSVLAVFVITLAYAWTAFPFTQDAPLKIFFEQSIQLGQTGSLVANSVVQGSINIASAAVGPVIQATTVLAGIYGYLDRKIIHELPSSWERDISCSTDKQTRIGLEVCSWTSDLIPSPGGNVTATGAVSPYHSAEPQWFTLNATRTGTSTAQINIKGFNTRSCQLQFDHPIHSFRVLNGGGRQLPGYDMPKDGVKSAVLYSRSWEKEFQVEVGWGGSDPDFVMEGRAACEWAEYASATAGGPHAGTSAQIPALEEVKAALPLWAVPTKYKVGLVEAWTRFRL